MNSILKISVLLYFFLLNGGQNNASNSLVLEKVPLVFKGKVTAIKDGDTFKVLYNGSERTVRLLHIDCPEKKQAFGTKAKQFAANLCFGKIVTVKTEGKADRYKRILGEIILPNGTNVNKELVKNGLAWHFKKYSKDAAYAKLEIQARKNRVGLWADKLPIAPWEFRKIKK
ncbi:thermonuclease family protein [Pedobacter alpinus]|uniref:Thermonuclease family protein n=1 Tax=Pedobacter alpinus TaxID=1590643 RepID=A0ABW5TW86_9SPHI